MLSVELNERQLAHVTKSLRGIRDGTQKALYRGNNKAAAKAKTRSKRIIGEEIALKKSTIADEMTVVKGNIKNSTSKLVIPDKGMLIGFFTFSELKSGRFTVKVKTKGKRWKTPADTYLVRRLKYSKPPKGSLAFGEYGSGTWMYGPSPSQAFEQKIDQDQFLEIMKELQAQEFISQMQRLLG